MDHERVTAIALVILGTIPTVLVFILDAILFFIHLLRDSIAELRPSKATLTRLASSKENGSGTMRDSIIGEIHSTEKTYTEKLIELQRHYEVPLKVLHPKEAAILFGDLAPIVALHGSLLNQLKTKDVGEVFVRSARFLKMYIPYVNRFDERIRVLDVIRKQKGAKAVLKKARHNNIEDIESLLINPVQRIPRYLLLLKELIKVTPEDHKDSRNLKEAFSMISEICSEVNSAKADADAREWMAEFQKRVKGEYDVYSNAQRRLVHRGSNVNFRVVQSKSGSKIKVCEAVLFDDVLIWLCKGKLGGELDLTKAICQPLTESSGSWLVVIESIDRDTVELGFSDQEVATTWHLRISAAIEGASLLESSRVN